MFCLQEASSQHHVHRAFIADFLCCRLLCRALPVPRRLDEWFRFCQRLRAFFVMFAPSFSLLYHGECGWVKEFYRILLRCWQYVSTSMSPAALLSVVWDRTTGTLQRQPICMARRLILLGHCSACRYACWSTHCTCRC
jgi:hypothetical protein